MHTGEVTFLKKFECTYQNVHNSPGMASSVVVFGLGNDRVSRRSDVGPSAADTGF